MTLKQFLIGVIGIPLGFFIIYFRVQIKDFTGDFGWAERYLGTGGTWSAIVLIGLMISIGSLLWMTGSLQGVIQNVFNPFF